MNTIVPLRRSPTDVLLELGGGANPIVHPRCMGGRDINSDVRACTLPDGRLTTDLVFDLNEPLPIKDGEFDGVISRYSIEHLSWRKVRQLVSEMFRVIKPGGHCLVITADVEAQVEWIKNHPNGWDGKPFFDSASCVLFGDQDYPENSHKCYFSHQVAREMFTEAGFEIDILQGYGDRSTDLILVATKPIQEEEPEAKVQQPVLLATPTIAAALTPISQSTYERFESALVRMFTREGDTVLDVGAHIGHYTLMLADCVGTTGNVIAFEPFAPSRTLLEKNIESAGLASRVDILPFALSDADGESPLYLNPTNSDDNHLWSKDGWAHVPVECRRLDSLMSIDSRINLVKIDTQGAEMRVLRGMKSILDAQERVVVFVEMWPLGMRYMDDSLEEFSNFFAGWRHAFMIWEKPPKLVPINSLDGLVEPGTSHFVNLIFVK